jgi:thiol-disulfide isomerase/thioredoxin
VGAERTQPAAATALPEAAGSRRRVLFLLPILASSGLLRMAGAALAIALPAVAISIRSVEAQSPAEFAVHESPRPLPDIQFENGQGEATSLADFRGKVVLLNIWATWCAPCRREMPTLERLQAELGGSDFEVVALSLDRKGLPAVKEFYEEIGLQELAMYVDESGAAQRALNVLGLPTTLLLDRDGNEIGRLLGPAEWDSPEMVSFIRGYVERQSGAALGGASDEVPLAFDAVRPAASSISSRPFLRVAGRNYLQRWKEQ